MSFKAVNSQLLVDSDPPLRPPLSKRIPLVVYVLLALAAAGIIVGIVLAITLPRSSSPPFSSFLYINDIHLDPLYRPRSLVTDKLRCRNDTASPAAEYPFGQYGCDPPEATFRSMLSFLPTALPNPDFILFGGDALAHGTGFNRSQIQSVFRLIITGISEVYPGVPVLVTLGNNEFWPNYGDFGNDTLDLPSLSEVMRPFMSEFQQDTFTRFGYYYYDIAKYKLRLLLLNTCIYSSKRGYTTEDPYGQFEWIRKSVANAHGQGYKVGAAMHIPPGISYIDLFQGWPDQYVEKFDQICKENDILFTLVGHTHYDMLMPVFGETGVSKGYSLSSPAISPEHSNNPAFRVIDYDENGIRNVHQYYADILMNPQSELKWQLEYSFGDAYSVQDLGKENLGKVVEWVTTTSEGTWRYKERVCSRAAENGGFYHCILKATTKKQVQDCMAGLQPIRAAAQLLPYGGEV